MRKNSFNYFVMLLFAFAAFSCDSGDIYPKERDNGSNINVSASFQFINLEAFPENYKIVFGSFNDESIYPISSKLLTKPSTDEAVTVSLTNIPEDATYLALYLVQEYSNSKIYPFFTYPIETSLNEDFELSLQKIDLTNFGRVQKQVFSQCIQCHGGSDFAAANLHLTDDRSYSELVNITALRNPNKLLVNPYNLQNSYLIDILRGEALQNQHSSLSSLKDDDVVLVEEWIKNGAKK